ncbi:MAG: PilZ domain-containing protein [Candidatus Acidiferrales bacterium]
MREKRHTHRYELFVPLQIYAGNSQFAQTQIAHLRDISTHGVYFVSDNSIPPGTPLDVQFSLPPERGRAHPVLVRGTGRALRIDRIAGESGKMFGIAAAIHRFDFVKPDERAA